MSMTRMLRTIALACLGLAVLASPALVAQGQPPPACAYSAAELTTTLGLTLAEGNGTSTPFPGGAMGSCEYAAKGGKVGVSLSHTTSATPAAARAVAGGLQGQAIPGDPDGAIWVAVVGDTSRVSLSYVRGSTHTEISLVGVNARDESSVAPLKAKLLKLRRLP